MFYEQFPIKLNGEDLVTRHGNDILKLLLIFHNKQLKPIPQPWRDRRSKLDR